MCNSERVYAGPGNHSLFISCMYLESSALNICLSYLLCLCWVRVFYVALSLTLTHKKSSPRSSLDHTADRNIEGAAAPCYPNNIEGLNMVAERGFPQASLLEIFVGLWCSWILLGVLVGCLSVACPLFKCNIPFNGEAAATDLC